MLCFSRDIREIPRGLVSSQGDEWKRCRNTFSKPLLKPAEVKQYRTVIKFSLEQLGSFLDQRNDKLTALKTENLQTYKSKLNLKNTINYLRSLVNPGQTSKQLDLLTLFKLWSLEVICSITFGKNQQLITYPIKKEPLDFIHAVDRIFHLGVLVFLMDPKLVRTYLTFNKGNRIFKYWDLIFNFCKPSIQTKLREVQNNATKTESGSSTDDGFLEILLSGNPKISNAEITSCVTELILGAIDQTSVTLTAILAEISINKNLQTELRSEILAMKNDDVSNVFVKAVIKEAFRMYPSVTRNIRESQEDMEIGGFKIPSKSTIMYGTYAISRSSKYFENPDEFKPERWLNASKTEMLREVSPFTIGNFGFGARSCIGRRLAEMQMYEAIRFVLTNYELSWNSDKDLEVYTTPMLSPVDLTPLVFTKLDTINKL